MYGFFQWRRSAFFAFIHLLHQKAHCFKCNLVDVLSNGADRNDCFCGNGGIVKSYQIVIPWQSSVSLNQQVQEYIGMGVAGNKQSFLFCWIVFLQLV